MLEDGRGLLALLDLADMNGDELTEALREWTGDAWAADRIEVGEAVDRLAHDGLVTVVTRHGRQPGAPASATYALTQAGREALALWLAAGDGPTSPPRPELLARVLLSLPGGRDRALQVITRQRSALTASLQARRRAIRPGASQQPAAAGATRSEAGDGHEPGAPGRHRPAM